MKIYEIDAAIMNCFDLETGEITDIEAFDALQMEREKKIENLACWIKDLEAKAEALKKQKDNFASRQAAIEAKAEKLSKYLEFVLGGVNFSSTLAEVKFRKTEKVEISDIYKIDEEYLTYKEPTANKNAIKKAIKAGQVIEGASLVSGLSMSIK